MKEQNHKKKEITEDGRRLIPLAQYFHPNRRGQDSTRQWKHRIVKDGSADFETVTRHDGIWVVLGTII